MERPPGTRGIFRKTGERGPAGDKGQDRGGGRGENQVFAPLRHLSHHCLWEGAPHCPCILEPVTKNPSPRDQGLERWLPGDRGRQCLASLAPLLSSKTQQ